LNTLVKRFNHVAVLKGGVSKEREISLRSGSAVAQGLRTAGYRVDEVDVQGPGVSLAPGVEAVFVVLHGAFGEDGQIQQILEDRGIPYTGSSPASCRNAFDKVLSKAIFEKAGVPTPAYQVFEAAVPAPEKGYPLVLKPACQGSSLGVHRVSGAHQWMDALEDALSFGGAVVAEAWIAGRELTVGILEGEALPVVEIVAPEDWFGYQAKYTQGQSQYRVPAPLAPEEQRVCQAAACRAFEALEANGFGRVDIRLSPEGVPWVLELNNIPGFTQTSLLPKAALCAGLEFPSLCTRIMESAGSPGRIMTT